MIDPLSESVIALSDVPALCPRRRRGKRPHLSCIFRWTTTGCKGVRLESIQIGGTRCTSREALARFFAALTAQCSGQSAAPVQRTSRQRERAIAAAERELAKAGV